ncbi:MAG: calcium-binding protein [Ktedonobacteraceae bacterium]
MEIIVDSYGPEERAMGRYYYLEGKIQILFYALCVAHWAPLGHEN